MLQVTLTQGQVTLVDDIDADIMQFKWSAGFRPNYADGGRYVAYRGNKNKTELLHRVIVARMLGRPLCTKDSVDHINRDTLDNRRANLRISTQQQNQGNRKKSKNNSSGYKGVVFNKRLGKWSAFIGYDGKPKYLGLFASPELAAQAYDKAAIEHFGEFALLNFPTTEVAK